MFLRSFHRYPNRGNNRERKAFLFFPAPKANLSRDSDAKLKGLRMNRSQPATEGEILMRKKTIVRSLLLSLVLVLGMSLGVHADSVATVDAAHGVVRITHAVSADAPIKVMVALGSQSYTYDLLKSTEAFPLQFGDGSYKISLYQRIQGTQYRLLEQKTVTVDLADDFVPFLGSSQVLNWSVDMPPIGKAKTLIAKAKTDNEKVQAVYTYVTAKIRYDYAKISKLKSSYVPDIQDTYATNLGICYDYSALFGSMLRSVGVPVKLVKGYKNDITEYHAFNQVYLNKKWVYIDTTYDAAFKAAGAKTTMVKSDSEFRPAKYY